MVVKIKIINESVLENGRYGNNKMPSYLVFEADSAYINYAEQDGSIRFYAYGCNIPEEVTKMLSLLVNKISRTHRDDRMCVNEIVLDMQEENSVLNQYIDSIYVNGDRLLYCDKGEN